VNDPTTFIEHTEAIAKSFLHTALVVDDRALPSGPPAEPVQDAEAHDRPVGRGVSTLVEPDSETDAEHELDLRALTEAFAARGVLCAALSPEQGDAPEDIAVKLLPAAARADLVILDWVLNGDNGERTKALLAKLLDHDRHRLRTVAIYTGQATLTDIANEVAAILDNADVDAHLCRQPQGLDMTKGPIRLVVLAKPDVDGVSPDRQESIDSLPERLTAEFAAMTRGLVSGVALAALGALRPDTHRILRLFSPDLDPAYLGHRMAQLTPDDAEDHLVRMVAAELAAVLADHGIGDEAALSPIKLWIAAQRASETGFRFGELVENKDLTDDQLHTSLEHGVEALIANKERGLGEKYVKNKLKKHATRVFSSTIEFADDADAAFISLMTLRTHYAHPPLYLTLGTIVGGDERWLICVQPVCDGIRLGHEPVGFPFFPLTVVTLGGDADFVARDRAGWKRLKLTPDPRTLQLLVFAADAETETVLAASHDGGHRFTDVNGEQWRWAGELKPDHAQRVAYQVGQRFARVGLDEPEILRLARAGRRPT